MIVTAVTVSMPKGDESEIFAKMEAFSQRRISKQPLELPSAGSMFKRPPGYFAGTLIDQTGLKGYTVGGAQVSTKHAGFVVNVGGATCADVLQLIKDVQDKVRAAHGVELQPEVLIIGVFRFSSAFSSFTERIISRPTTVVPYSLKMMSSME